METAPAQPEEAATMTILVVGAGATGGYFGLRLAQAGRDVTFLVRPGRAEALRRRGLRLVGLEPDERIDPQLVTASELSRHYDTVLLTVKATGLEHALDDLTPAVGPETRIVPFLNGMAHLDRLNQRFGPIVVLGGVVKVATQLNADGDIVQVAPGGSMEIGAQSGIPSIRLERAAAELAGAGFDFSVRDDILTAMWAKWAFIATIGALTCLMRGVVGDIAACPGGPQLGPAILAEAAAIAAANGHELADADLEATAALVTTPGSPLASSMYRDVTDGNHTEVEQILGDLIARARQAGTASPVLDLATLHLRVYEHRHA
jgi:2-dehydropantoate 2-reductase